MFHIPGNPFFVPCQDDLQEPRNTLFGNVQVDLAVYCSKSGKPRSHYDKILASLVPYGTGPLERSTSIVSKGKVTVGIRKEAKSRSHY
jgi:hypothetical protein